MQPLLVLNFKAFETATGSNAVKLAKIADDFAKKSKEFQVVLAPSFIDLIPVKNAVSNCWVFSQHVDNCESGSFTGSQCASLIYNYCQGTILNHAERKISLQVLESTIEICKKYKLKTLACADTVSEAEKISQLSPDFIAIEPPELIGSGVSVSTAQPALVVNVIKTVKEINSALPVLVGAGISTPEDVRKAIELGADGVLVASAFIKSKNPKKWLSQLLPLLR